MANEKIEELKRKIKPCDSEKDFVFVSYSKKDSEQVYGLVVDLQKKGFNIWMDKELTRNVGENWQDKALEQLQSKHCKAVLFMVSKNSLVSSPVYAELSYSRKSKKVTRHNNKEPLKIVPIIVDANLKVNDNEWIEEVKEDDTELTESDYANMKCVGCIDKEHYESKANRFTELGEIADAICEEILEGIDKGQKILVSINDIDTIKTNIPDSVYSETESSETADDEDTTDESADEKTETVSRDVVSEKSSNGRGSSSTGMITYTLYGVEKTDNQSNMMLEIFAKVLKRHPEAVDKILDDPEYPLMRCASATDYSLKENRTDDMPSRYIQGCYFEIGKGIFIGTGLNYKEKLRNIAQLFEITGEDTSVLQSDQITLPKVSIKQDSGKSGGGANFRGSGETYSIYGQEYSGNQSEMMCNVLHYLVENHFEKIEELANLSCIKTKPMSQLTNNNFRTGGEYTHNGVTYSIGTSYSRKDKVKLIAKAIKICDEDFSQFEIDGLEDVGSSSSSVRRSTAKRNFLDD